MAIRTPKEYLESLRDGRTIYHRGQKYNDVTAHPSLRLGLQRCILDYVMAQEPRYKDLIIEKDDNGEPYPFVYRPPRDAADLLRRLDIIETGSRIVGGAAASARLGGPDALHAVTSVSRMVDKKFGTSYEERVESFREELKRIDAATAIGMTGVKGNRSLRPSKQQQHKDFYVRMVDKSDDGIVVNGALAHISHAPFVNYIMVLPCRAMEEDDKDYAVSFAVSPGEKGIKLIYPEPVYFEEGNYFEYPHAARIGYSDCMIVFDNVFIPRERVFLCGEWQFAGPSAYMFANFHRLTADAYKVTTLEVDVGAALLMAEYNGLDKDRLIRDKLSWLIFYAETTKALARAACQSLATDPVSGYIYPDAMISNCCKFFFADNYHQALKLIQDISGGIVATIPNTKDYLNPEIHQVLEKYLAGKDGIPTEHRIRAIKLVKDLGDSFGQVWTLHAEGSLAAQKLAFLHVAELDRYRAAAKRVAGIEDGTEHPLYSQLIKWPQPLEDIIK